MTARLPDNKASRTMISTATRRRWKLPRVISIWRAGSAGRARKTALDRRGGGGGGCCCSAFGSVRVGRRRRAGTGRGDEILAVPNPIVRLVLSRYAYLSNLDSVINIVCNHARVNTHRNTAPCVPRPNFAPQQRQGARARACNLCLLPHLRASRATPSRATIRLLPLIGTIRGNWRTSVVSFARSRIRRHVTPSPLSPPVTKTGPLLRRATEFGSPSRSLARVSAVTFYGSTRFPVAPANRSESTDRRGRAILRISSLEFSYWISRHWGERNSTETNHPGSDYGGRSPQRRAAFDEAESHADRGPRRRERRDGNFHETVGQARRSRASATDAGKLHNARTYIRRRVCANLASRPICGAPAGGRG